MNNPAHQSPAGRLELICGPMFAGKTTELIRRLDAARAAQEITLAIKPAKDTRYADQELVTHAGGRTHAIAAASRRRMSSVVLPANMGPQINSSRPVGDGCAGLFMCVSQEILVGARL